MKELEILCPNCDSILEISKEIKCKNCFKLFSYKNNIISFNDVNSNNNELKKEINHFFDEINKEGYKKAVKNFLKKFPKYTTQLINPEFNQSIDHIFYSLTKENKRCLVLENDFGNTVETLSNIFYEVISQNSSEDFLKLQSKRFEEIKKENVTLIHSNFEKFYFPENYFDFIVIENFFNKIDIKNKKKIEVIINEISRILKVEGCLIFTYKEIDEELNQILEKTNFKIQKYWSMQSSQNPTFSGKYDDEVGLKWYMDNISKFLITKKVSLKKKMMLWTMKNSSRQSVKIFKKKFVPTVIFCCFKGNLSTTISDFVEKKTGYKHYVIQSRPKKIIGVLIDEKGTSQKIINFNRYGYDFPTAITIAERKFPKMNDPNERIWMENWYEGISINPEKMKDVSHALDWLIKFQNTTKQDLIDEKYIQFEIDEIKNNIKRNSLLNNSQCFKWLENYSLFLKKNNFHHTAIHGDFWINNILINPKTSEINVLDWEKYSEKGNPLYDFMFFFIRLMTKTKTSSLDLEKFSIYINEKTDEYKQISQLIKKIDLHFNCKFEFLTVLRVYIIKRILTPPYGSSIAIKRDVDDQIKMLELLSRKQALFV